MGGLIFYFFYFKVRGNVREYLNPLSANPTKRSKTLKQFVRKTDELFERVWPFCAVGT